MWISYALLSAFFAALTSILAKIGIENINSKLATAIRTIIVLVMSWAIVLITGKHNEIANIGHKNLFFLILSGIATGLSWLCYYKALQI
jgi:transporter family protein